VPSAARDPGRNITGWLAALQSSAGNGHVHSPEPREQQWHAPETREPGKYACPAWPGRQLREWRLSGRLLASGREA
jgi:hypothetical protein